MVNVLASRVQRSKCHTANYTDSLEALSSTMKTTFKQNQSQALRYTLNLDGNRLTCVISLQDGEWVLNPGSAIQYSRCGRMSRRL